MKVVITIYDFPFSGNNQSPPQKEAGLFIIQSNISALDKLGRKIMLQKDIGSFCEAPRRGKTSEV
jgi:hypothetical protein